MNIRVARPDEWQVVQELNNEVFIDNAKYDPDLVLDWAHSDQGRKYFQDLVVDPSSRCWVAEHNDRRLVGYLAASPKIISYRKSCYLEIDNMGVIPQFRSQGVGKLLMETCKKWAQENNYEKLFVNSYAKNEKAIRYYQSCGFEIIDISLEYEIQKRHSL